MNKNQIQKEYSDYIEKNKSIIKTLEPYTKRTVKDLPDNIKKQLSNIKFGPKLTSSGIEDVLKIIDSLIATNTYLQLAIDNPQEFLETYSKNKNNKPATNQKQIDIAAKEKPQQINIKDAPEKVHINITDDKNDTPKPTPTEKKDENISIKIKPQQNKPSQEPQSPPTSSKIEL